VKFKVAGSGCTHPTDVRVLAWPENSLLPKLHGEARQRVLRISQAAPRGLNDRYEFWIERHHRVPGGALYRGNGHGHLETVAPGILPVCPPSGVRAPKFSCARISKMRRRLRGSLRG
jgi:hypothetical protein